MLYGQIISTVNQKVLTFLTKFSDKEFYERQIARSLGIAFGSANRSLNNLYAAGAVRRRQEGKMFFYSVNVSDPVIIQLKKLINLLLLEPLLGELKSVSTRIILYGSCAQGADGSRSDLDLFVVSTDREQAIKMVDNFSFPRGFEGIRIQSVIKTPSELLMAGEAERVFLNEVDQGIILWEKAANDDI